MKIIIIFLLISCTASQEKPKEPSFDYTPLGTINSKTKLKKEIFILPIKETDKNKNHDGCSFLKTLILHYCENDRNQLLSEDGFMNLNEFLKMELDYKEIFSKTELIKDFKIEKNKTYIQIEFLESKIKQKQIELYLVSFAILTGSTGGQGSWSAWWIRVYSTLWLPYFLGFPFKVIDAEINIRFKLIESNLIILEKTYKRNFNEKEGIYYNNEEKVRLKFYDKKNLKKLVLPIFQEILHDFTNLTIQKLEGKNYE